MKQFTSQKQKIGEIGENIAVDYLISKGFLVLHRNFTVRGGEIDIIAQKNNKTHYIEVKSMHSKDIGDIDVSREIAKASTYNLFENITSKKLRRIQTAISLFHEKHNVHKSYQIDGVVVWFDSSTKKAQVQMIENINI